MDREIKNQSSYMDWTTEKDSKIDLRLFYANLSTSDWAPCRWALQPSNDK
jgi:hypothetical protein